MPLPTFNQAEYEALLARRRQNDQEQLSLQAGINGAQQSLYAPGGPEALLLDAQRRQSAARLGVIGAQAGLVPIQRSINAAQGNTLNAEGVQLAGQRGVIGLQQEQLGQQTADLGLIRSARANIADKTAVAQEGLRQNVEDSRLYGRLGVEAPVSVDVPPGASSAGLGLGTRASLKTQEEVVRGQVADREADRAATLKGAQLALQMSGTNVTEAELMARRLGLTLDDAKLLVDEAQTRESLAGVDVNNANLDTQQAGLNIKSMGVNLDASQLTGKGIGLGLNEQKAPADQGYELYTDPTTMQKSWVTPAEADQLQHAYEVSLTRARIPESISLQQSREQQAQQQLGGGNPLYGSSPTVMAQYLAHATDRVPTQDVPASSAEAQVPFNATAAYKAQSARAIALVADALRRQNPYASDAVINTMLLTIINSAKADQARQQDEADDSELGVPATSQPGARAGAR